MQSLHSAITTPPTLETTAERGQDVPPLATPRFLLLTRRVNQKPARRTPPLLPAHPRNPHRVSWPTTAYPLQRPPCALAANFPSLQLSNKSTSRQVGKLASARRTTRGGEPPSVTWSVHHTPSNAPAPAEPTPAPSTRAGCLLSLLPRGTRARSPPPRRLPAPPHPSSPPDLTPSATRGTRAHPTSATATATPPSSRTPPPHNAAKRPNPIPLSYPGVNHGTPAEPPSVPAEPASSFSSLPRR